MKIMTEKEISNVSKFPSLMENDVMCERFDDFDIWTNVPKRICYHSPDGFEWGYGGSGPSDFALNILSIYVGGEKALKLHQQFKQDFVAKLPKQGGTIKKEDILKWIDETNENQN